MKGMMLGFFDPLITLLENLIMGILSPVINFLMEWLVAPLINFLFSIVNYIISLYLYTISIFILGLIDFVEMLFRALAGLGSTGSGIELSIGGKSGDILLQLLRHQDVQKAFLAMCIVGIFLLIVTTVFQIIKVEYTTEGAKNSKTPIFQKAFKGLANLMLLPILCVFGIVFANQLLGLLDKATRADGNNPTISGTLFVTSASEAHYKKNDAQFVMFTANLNMAIPQVLLNSLPILYQSVKDMAEGYKENITDSSFNEDYRWDVDEVESGFINQSEGYKYYNIAAVSAYYNYGKINYLLLILGGVTVIKCLYFTCFGMVIRLYKCAVLFIISPAVIGMTPVNEGGLGKWRGQFIGQVLSAYGTILSINIFFIIVRVLLAVEVKFVNMGNFTFWGEHFMTGLLKSIFVMAGCLLIEKFAKELGGFFGAEDAMGAGKDMSKQVVDTAMKGVEVAGAVGRTIATGGAASLAATIGGVKNVAGGFKEGGIAGGLKAIGGEFKDHTLVGKAIGFVQNKYQANRDKDTVDYYESDKGQRSLKRAREQNKYSQEQIDKIKNTKEYKDSYNKVESAKADLEKAKKSLNREKITKAQNKLTNAEQEYQAKYGKKIDRYQNTIDANNKNIESYSGAKKRIEDREKDKEDKKQKRAEAIARTTSYVG
ncbi:MAG: Mbov_0396 family ICE element transmembrane protein, partial [Christensenellales bacterium]